MSETKFECGFDENGNPALYEVDSSGRRTKVVTLFPDGSVVFEKPYDSQPDAVKRGWVDGVKTCPTKK
jgi:hypothetical protein